MRRIRTRDGHVEFAGRDMRHSLGDDGVEIGPEGEELRQIVQARLSWECTTWCSRDGVCYDRCYDPFQDRFLWSAPKTLGMDRATGHFTILVGRDPDLRRSMRLSRALALAWVEPPRTMVKLQACVLPNMDATADHLVWVRTGVREFTLDGVQQEPRTLPFAGDTWRPLRYQWRTLHGEVTHTFVADEDAPYEVSVRGWLRRGDHVTQGARLEGDGRLFASIAGVGAIFLDEAVLYTFAPPPSTPGVACLACRVVHINGNPSDNALANLKWASYVVTQSRHEEMADAANLGVSMATLCSKAGVQSSTLWGHIEAAARELPLDRARDAFSRFAFARLRIGEGFKSSALDAADPLARFMEWCDAEPPGPAWHQLDAADRYGIVKVSMVLVVREAMQSQ